MCYHRSQIQRRISCTDAGRAHHFQLECLHAVLEESMFRLWKTLGLVLVVGIILARPEIGLAQQASIVGTVVDESKAVLPGVTVIATQVDTGRQFMSLTAEAGGYRLVGLPAGKYDL